MAGRPQDGASQFFRRVEGSLASGNAPSSLVISDEPRCPLSALRGVPPTAGFLLSRPAAAGR